MVATGGQAAIDDSSHTLLLSVDEVSLVQWLAQASVGRGRESRLIDHAGVCRNLGGEGTKPAACCCIFIRVGAATSDAVVFG